MWPFKILVFAHLLCYVCTTTCYDEFLGNHSIRVQISLSSSLVQDHIVGTNFRLSKITSEGRANLLETEGDAYLRIEGIVFSFRQHAYTLTLFFALLSRFHYLSLTKFPLNSTISLLIFSLLEGIKKWRIKQKGGSILYPKLQHPWPSNDMQRIRAIEGYGWLTRLVGKAHQSPPNEGRKELACRTLGDSVSGFLLVKQSWQVTCIPIGMPVEWKILWGWRACSLGNFLRYFYMQALPEGREKECLVPKPCPQLWVRKNLRLCVRCVLWFLLKI